MLEKIVNHLFYLKAILHSEEEHNLIFPFFNLKGNIIETTVLFSLDETNKRTEA